MASQERRGGYRGKRIVDLALLLAAVLPASVAGLVCAVLVRATSRGPILFRQERVGLDGERFVLLKFRSMVDAADNPEFPDPSRITSVGRWLRRWSLDEIPQLINVARGEMSIVGPRPTLPYQVERYDDRQRRRLTVNPGVTGLAQIRGRNEIAWAERIEHDLEYVVRQGIGLDLTIVWETARQLFSSRGIEGHPVDDPIAVRDDKPSDDSGRRGAERPNSEGGR